MEVTIVRENFVFDKQIKAKKRLQAFNRLKGSAAGLFGDASIQSIKADREL